MGGVGDFDLFGKSVVFKAKASEQISAIFLKILLVSRYLTHNDQDNFKKNSYQNRKETIMITDERPSGISLEELLDNLKLSKNFVICQSHIILPISWS